MKQRRMTPDALQQVIALRLKAWSVEEISKKFGFSRGCVKWHLLKEGVDPPKLMSAPRSSPTVPVAIKRGRHVVRLFTAAEDTQLLALEAQGLTYVQIGKIVR